MEELFHQMYNASGIVWLLIIFGVWGFIGCIYNSIENRELEKRIKDLELKQMLK